MYFDLFLIWHSAVFGRGWGKNRRGWGFSLHTFASKKEEDTCPVREPKELDMHGGWSMPDIQHWGDQGGRIAVKASLGDSCVVADRGQGCRVRREGQTDAVA